jgi:type I restriction enzyme S subunit
MSAERLFAYFEFVVDATDAIHRLRTLILELAVRGKIFDRENWPNANSVFLEKKHACTENIPQESSRDSPPKEIGNTTANPFDVPDNWTWASLGDVSSKITKGSTPTTYGHSFQSSGIRFIKVESIRNSTIDKESNPTFISSETDQSMHRSRLMGGDILFSIAGSIGKCAVVDESNLPANVNQALAIVRGTDRFFIDPFILICLRSSVVATLVARARGGAMNNISLADIRQLALPLPPLSEQHRIVAKVEELMALCDRLEAARAEREATRDRMTVASLARLNTPDPDPATFATHARFALDHLPALTARPDQIKHLRQTILNLAVRGKLIVSRGVV